MTANAQVLCAEVATGKHAGELRASFGELDGGASFATSAAWNRAAAAVVGAERLVDVVLRDEGRAAVGLLTLEHQAAGWRSGSPGRTCLTWPMAAIGYRYGPRFDPALPAEARAGWLGAVQALFPGSRIELRRTVADADPRLGSVAGPQHARIEAGAGTWRLRPVGDRAGYLACLKGKHRRDLSLYRRNIERLGATWIDCDGTAAQARALLGACFDLHARRLHEKAAHSAYLTPTGRRFLEALVEETRSGALRLTLLRCQGRYVAGCLAFVDRGRYWALMSGWERDCARLDLGRQVIYHQILRELERGLEEIDLLGGDLDYKREFGLAAEPTLDIVVHPDAAAAQREALVAGAIGLYRASRALLGRRRAQRASR